MGTRRLNAYSERSWKDLLLQGKPIDERWLARQLNPYGIRARNLRIEGVQAKGYCQEDLVEPIRRYVPKAEARALLDEFTQVSEEGPDQSGSERAIGERTAAEN
jgi:hypothetical protein